MSQNNTRYLIAAKGKLDISPKLWLSWLQFGEEFMKDNSLEPTHIGFDNMSLKSTKTLTYKRSVKKVRERILNGEEVTTLSLFVVPENFKSLSIDWEVDLTMYTFLGNELIFLGFPLEYKDRYGEDEWIEKLKDFIHLQSIKFFVMDVRDHPVLYALKGSKELEEKVTILFEKQFG